MPAPVLLRATNEAALDHVPLDALRECAADAPDDLAELLGDTYGLMIYQESVMRVAQKFAGYSLAEADNLRKACGKKIREMMLQQEKEGARFLHHKEKVRV